MPHPHCSKSQGGKTWLILHALGTPFLWTLFRQYHYLNVKLDAGVRCYVAFYQNKSVAFMAVVCTKMKRKYYRVSRLVVQPDYQESFNIQASNLPLELN